MFQVSGWKRSTNSCSSVMMRRLLFILLLLGCISCQDRELDTLTSELQMVEFISTKGVGDNKAYMVYLVGIDGTTTDGVVATGTYCDKTEGGQFTPCAVNDDGTYLQDDDTKGLRAINGPYKMYVVYPAIPMSDSRGYFYDRNPQGVYISETEDVSLAGVYLSDANGSHYIYDGSAMELKQPRSQVSVKFACGNDIESTTLQKISLKNIIPEGYYKPEESKFYYDAETISVDIYDSNGGEGLTLTTGESSPVGEGSEYILSMDYGEKDAQGNTIWPLPSFEIHIGDSSTNVVSFTAALGWDFNPQYSYIFTITVNSLYVNIKVTAIPSWINGGDHSTSVDEPQVWTIEFPLVDGSQNNLLDWDVVDGITGVIGGDE